MASLTATCTTSSSCFTRGRAPVRAAAVSPSTRAHATRGESPPRAADRPASGASASSPMDEVVHAIENFKQKYDVLSALLGSLVVTSFFVSRGQDPFFALGLTAAATVIALVADDLLFDDR